MKSFQWLLLLALLMVVVFGITFLRMNVDPPTKTPGTQKTTGKGGSTEGPLRRLDFVSTRYPPETRSDLLPPQTEYGRGGAHDFWFHNPHDAEVLLGLVGKSCTCSQVQVHVLQGDWRPPIVGARLAPLLAAVPGAPLAAATVSGAAEQRFTEVVAERTKGGMHTLEKEDENATATVAPHAVGYLRLAWDARRSGAEPFRPQTLMAGLWFTRRTELADLSLQVLNAWMVEPYLFDSQKATLSPMTPDEPRRRAAFRCWSATRSNLQLVADTGGDPFVRCSLQPLTADDETLVRSIAPLAPQVRSGHRLVVEVKPRTPDGKFLDLGPFRRRIQVKVLADGAELGSESLVVEGEVKGDVRLIPPGNQTSGVLAFDTFRASSGKTLEATVEAERANVVVQIEKVPDFLEATLERLPGSDRPRWRLRVRVLPGRTQGTLPRDESEIVLAVRAPGESLRRLRVPVTGEATTQ